MLILPRNKKIEVAFAGQNGINAPTAFPETIGDIGFLKALKNCEKNKRDCALRRRLRRRFKFFMDLDRPHDRIAPASRASLVGCSVAKSAFCHGQD
jgi:hypothetical protein